jgi:hypothetical protein
VFLSPTIGIRFTPVDLVVTGEHFLLSLGAFVSSISVSSAFSATALLLFGEDLVASPWIELWVFLSSGGAYGCAPL